MSIIEQSQSLTGIRAGAKIPFWRQIRWNLIMFAVVLTVIPVLVIGLFFLEQARLQTITQINRQLESVTTLKENGIARWLNTSNQLMDIFLSKATSSNLLVNFATEGVGGSLSAFVNATLLDGVDAQGVDDAAYKEFFLYDLNGEIIASSNNAQVGKIVSRQPYFAASLEGNYVQSPFYDVSNSELTMIVTRPVAGVDGKTVAIVAGRLNLTTLGNIMTERSGLGETGETYLVSLENNYLLTPSRFEGYTLNRAYRSPGITNALSGQDGLGIYTGYRNIPVIGVYRWNPELKAAFLAEIDEAEALAPFNQTALISTLVVGLAALGAGAAAFYYATRVSQPIVALTGIASRIAHGDLTQRAGRGERNEIGVLASTFNSMADQLQNFVGTLEDRVNARTRDLQIVANVSKSTTTILNADELLQSVVDLTKDSFELYHVHIYLLDAAGQNLLLAAGAGEPGRIMKERGHSIPLNREHSLVARSARERQGVIVNDVTQEADFLPNSLLPNTQSELAVPMVVGDRLIGVLDVQADSTNRFSHEDVRIQISLADQVSVAVENARAFAEIQQAQAAVRLNQEQLLEAQRIARLGRWEWTPATGEVAWNELMFEHFDLPTDTQPSFELFMSRIHPDDAPQLTKVIEEAFQSGATTFSDDYRVITGHNEIRYHSAIGSITRTEEGMALRVVGTAHDISERKQVEIEREILFAASNRLNNARNTSDVLDALLPYAHSSGASSASLLYIDSDQNGTPEWANVVGEWSSTHISTIPVGMRFYLPEFPFSKLWMSNPSDPVFVEDIHTDNRVDEMTRGVMEQSGSRALAIIPLSTQGRWVGIATFSWKEAVHFTEQDHRIYTSLTRQTTATVDALRSAEETQNRAAELEMVAQVSAATTSILDVNELLQSVVDLTQAGFNLYHAHVYLLDEAGESLMLAAGVGEAGRIMKERGHSIPLNRPNSLVARAARGRAGVISNDVTQEPDFLPNPLLPNTKSEMAVPLVIGERVVGVLDMQADVTNRFTEADVRVKTTLADQIAVAVENARAFANVEAAQEITRELNERFSSIGATMPGAIFQFTFKDGVWATPYMSEGVYDIVGVTAEEVKLDLNKFTERVHPGDLDRYIASVTQVIETLEDWEFEGRAIKPSGEVVWWQSASRPTRLASGEVVFNGALFDITARKHAEQEQEILYEVSRQLSNANNSADVLEAMYSYLETRSGSSASMFHIDTEEGVPTWLETVAARSNTPEGTAAIGSRYYLPDFPFSRVWMSHPNEPVLIGDMETLLESDPAAYGVFKQFGISASAVIPLYAQDRWLGLITLSWSEPTTFSPYDERILTSFMRQATSKVDALRASQLTAKRAAELQTVAQVSAAATMLLETDALLQSVVDLTKEAFNLYHAHVYLMDERGENLVLTAGAGEPGRIMKEQGRTISISQQNSLVARATRSRDGAISNDVTQEADFLPNPLLPETRSEMAIPMIVGDEVIGVLDVQADRINHFTASDVAIQSTLADQIAVAVQNARAFQITQETAERLREVDRLKSQFLANMSHELRTPLNSIIGYAEVLLDGIDGDLSDEAVEDVEAIHGGGKHLLTIINDILDLAKIEAGQMFMDRQEARLTQVVDEVVATCQILAKNKDISLNVELEGSIPTVFGDTIRLKQIIFNLVNNAIKFTEKGGITVNMGMMNENNEVVVSVRDTGMGMTQEDIGGLFQQFHQVDGSATRRAGGTGLGLVITRHLVHMHGGEIYVESEKGAGSTFWFTLPVYANQPRQKA